jgi:hypothetical protein
MDYVDTDGYPVETLERQWGVEWREDWKRAEILKQAPIDYHHHQHLCPVAQHHFETTTDVCGRKTLTAQQVFAPSYRT